MTLVDLIYRVAFVAIGAALGAATLRSKPLRASGPAWLHFLAWCAFWPALLILLALQAAANKTLRVLQAIAIKMWG